MPSFTGQVPNLVAAGPIVEVVIGPGRAFVEELSAKGQPVPAPVRAIAMIDTGASGTVISPTIVQSLGLQPVGVAQMSTPSTHQPVQASIFNINLDFPHGVTINDAAAIEAPLSGQHIQCLVGRDILQHGVLVYVGYINQFTLSF